MDIHIFLAAMHGLIMGTLLGCIPGLGVLSGVLLSMPFLLDYSALAVFIFYLAMIIASQYTGSIVATYFGIMGELTSAPAAKVGYALYRRGHGSHAIILGALGSVCATFFFHHYDLSVNRIFEQTIVDT
jgi:putative tricarboxylic transport membrane protein